jgi:hypothetical protein
MPSCFKDVPTTPIVGQLDLRSPSGTLAENDFRLLYNVRLAEGKNRCRDSGWKRLFRDSPYGFKNQDFHDQLLGCQGYYEETVQTFTSGGEVVGSEFINFTPAQTLHFAAQSYSFGTYIGYYPDEPNISPDSMAMDEFVAWSSHTGLPYFSIPTGDATFYGYTSGSPFYYVESYYDLRYFHQEPDRIISASASEPADVVSPLDSYEYTVCGGALYPRDGCREAITLIGQVNSESGTRKLYVATRSRIATLNERTGNWKLIADGLGGPVTDDNCGCSSRRFLSATLGGFTFFTNNYDPVLQWRYDSPTASCKLWAADYVEDLLTLGITRAKCVVEWKGFFLVGAVEQDGAQRPFRIFWSDFNDPTSFIPGAESLAGFQDFSAGEEIIAMAKLGGGLRVYTNKAIYAASLVGGELVFTFEEIYSGPNRIAFQYSLANAGDTHYYLSFDSVYRLRESDRSPTMEPWMHKAAGAIYVGVAAEYFKSFALLSPSEPVNLAACDQVIGYYRKETDELFFSWPTGTATCPNLTLRMALRYAGSDLIDYGFTAFAEFNSDTRPSVIDWLVDQQLCNWDSSFAELIKEGIPYSVDLATFPNPPDCLINPTEDPTLPSSENSWCARLGRKTIDDFCAACDDQITFIGASASDKTLKEFDDEIYYREELSDFGAELDCPYTSEATYARNGYTSLAQHDLIDYGVKLEKTIERVVIDFDALDQSTPGQLYVSVAYARNAHCPTWSEVRNKPFSCISDYSDEAAAFYHVRPNEMPVFKFMRRGGFIGLRWYLTGTGSGGCFTKVTRRMRIAQSKWP